MKRSTVIFGAGVAAVCILGAGLAAAQAVNEFPKREDPLNVRVDLFDKLMRGNHWNEGTMMPHIIFPPAGKDTPIVGSQEDCPLHTGLYLASQSFRYAVTKDPQAREWADQTLEGLLKLEQVTGEPGCLARSFNRTDAPNWHEQAFFFPMEWHESDALPGYRWMGDLSSDQLTGVMFGLGVYWELCADDVHKATAADLTDRIMQRCVENNFRIVDIDGKMTLWGNFCPDLPHEKLNSLLILSHLRTAFKITGSIAYRTAHDRLITKYHYDDEAILAKVLWPEEWRNGSDDFLAALAFYHLLRFEEDDTLKQKYRMSLNRHWYLWKEMHDPFYDMLYQVLTGEKVIGDPTLANIKGMWGFDRNRRDWSIASEGGTQTVSAEEEGDASKMILNYWFGRHYSLIDPAW